MQMRDVISERLKQIACEWLKQFKYSVIDDVVKAALTSELHFFLGNLKLHKKIYDYMLEVVEQENSILITWKVETLPTVTDTYCGYISINGKSMSYEIHEYSC